MRAAASGQLVPEFRVSQNDERPEVLELIRERLGCGYIKANSKKDRALVLVVRERSALLESVIPFFERVPLLSAKRIEVEEFAHVVRAMAGGQHLQPDGFRGLLDIAVTMNGGGRFRQVAWRELVGDA